MPIFVEHRMNGLSALDPASGALLWRRPGGITTAHALLPNALVVGVYGDPLLALSPWTGEQLWRLDAPTQSLAVAGGRVIVAGYDLFCLTDEGEPLWTVKGTLDGEVADVQVSGELAVLTSNGVKAYRVADGAPAWTAAPGPARDAEWEDPRWTGHVDASVVERGGVLYGCGWSSAFALDPVDGRTRFHRRFGGDYSQMGAPVLAGDTMLCASVYRANGFVEALDAADGSSRWRLDLPWCEGERMIALSSMLVIPGHRELFGIDVARGAVAWRKAWPPTVWDAQVVGDHLLMSSGGLHALDSRDGSFLWSAVGEEDRGCMFARVREGVVIAPSRSKVIARRVEDGALLWISEVPEMGDDFLLRVFG